MKHIGQPLPFGLKDGKMLEVSEVDRGAACGCLCPKCSSPLQANKGEKRQYFSHHPRYRKTHCEGALETAIHKMAKQVLIENHYLLVPELVVKESLERGYKTYELEEVVSQRGISHFEDIQAEVFHGGIRPDVLGYTNGRPFYIEIAVTHFVDEGKREKIRASGIPTIEVDLSKLNRLPTKHEIFEWVIESSKNKKWVFNPRESEVRYRLIQQLSENADAYQKRLSRHSMLSDTKKSFKRPRRAAPRKLLCDSDAFKELKSRWIRCESCHKVFQKSFEEAPLEKPTIECPECGYFASGALSSSGRLPSTD